MIVTLNRIYKKLTDTKYGKKNKVGIKVDKYGDTWLNGWEGKISEDWKEGDQIDITVTKDQYGLKFKANEMSPSDIEITSENNVQKSIEKMAEDKQKGAEIGNARTNATNIAIAVYNKGEIDKEGIENYIQSFVNFFLNDNADKQNLVNEEDISQEEQEPLPF